LPGKEGYLQGKEAHTMSEDTRDPALDRSSMAEVAKDGFIAGVIGAATVAIFFFVVDLLGGRPFYTPSLLGSIFFQGADPARVTEVEAAMVVAYTAVHVVAFILVGLAAAYVVHQFKVRPHFGVVLLLLFICFEAGFLGFALGFAPSLIPAIGGWLIAAANLLSASAMAFYLLVLRHPRAFQNLDQVFSDETP
jgi:hypothetical protein